MNNTYEMLAIWLLVYNSLDRKDGSASTKLKLDKTYDLVLFNSNDREHVQKWYDLGYLRTVSDEREDTNFSYRISVTLTQKFLDLVLLSEL